MKTRINPWFHKSASLNRGGTQQEVLWHTHAPDGTSQVPHPGKVGEPSREEAAVTVLPADPAHNQANLALETFSARCWPAAWRSTCFPYTTVPTPKETWSTFFVEKIISPMSPRKNGSGRASFTGPLRGLHQTRVATREDPWPIHSMEFSRVEYLSG